MDRNTIIARAGALHYECERRARAAESAELFAPFGLTAPPRVPASDWYGLGGWNGGFADLANKACGEWPVRACARRLAQLRRQFRALEARAV